MTRTWDDRLRDRIDALPTPLWLLSFVAALVLVFGTAAGALYLLGVGR